MDSLKQWAIQVGLKKFGPSLIRAALAGLTGILLAHSGMLDKYGISYDKATDTIIWHLSALKEWIDLTGLGLIAGLFTVAQHHTVATVTGAPQDGSHQRADDQPKGE